MCRNNFIYCGELSQIFLMGYITNVLILEILSRSSTYSTFKAYIICVIEIFLRIPL